MFNGDRPHTAVKIESNTTTNTEDSILEKINMEGFYKTLTFQEALLVLQLKDGYSVTETAERISLSRRYTTTLLKNIRIRATEFLGEN